MMNGGYIALIVCLVLTTAARKDGIYEIGKAHCPCTRFCNDDIETVYTNGTEELILTGSSSDEGKADVCSGNDIFQPQETVSKSTNQTVLCCGNCSCEDDCWRTANCCPDKETIREEPALTCRSPVVKPILGKSRSNLGYQVIDTCPFTEINDTLVSKCISNEIHDLAGLIWVFDKQQEMTYKNEYCALCHHVTHFVKWKLRVKCDKLSSTADLSPLFMLDDRCELKLEKPENTTATSFPVCLIADYNHCNQTGLWSTYDADIERSCDIYHSIYIFADWYLMPPMTYKNVFCYQCNTVETMVTNPVCVLSGDFVQVKSKQEVQSICNRF